MSKNVDFDAVAFVSELTAAGTRSGGAESKWKLNLDKLAVGKEKVLQLPLQARILVKALILNKDAAAISFTYSQWAVWATESGLETRQGALRIVRYYSKEIRQICLEAIK